MRAACALAAAWVMIGAARLWHHPSADLANHRVLGARFFTGGDLYAGGLDHVYPPFWAMLFALPLSPWLLFGLGVPAMFGLLGAARRMTGVDWRAAAAAVLVCAPVVDRDMADCFLNTILAALTWLGLEQWTRGRDLRGGALVGLAVALKCTPALFIVYFAVRRAWGMLAATVAFALLFTLLPMPWQSAAYGPWLRGVLTVRADPSEGLLGAEVAGRAGVVYEDRVGNLALRPALARYLMRYPYLHLGRPETSDTPTRPHDPPSRWFLTFLDLGPEAAGTVTRMAMLGLLLAVFGAIALRPGEIGPECAAISVLMLLLSPITWTQHCVWALPALCLLLGRRQALPMVVVFAVCFLLGSKDIFGRVLVSLLDSYHIKTLGLLCLLLGVMLTRRAR